MEQRVGHIKQLLGQAIALVTQMETTDLSVFGEHAFLKHMELVTLSEKIAVEARLLPTIYGFKEEQIETHRIKNSDISFRTYGNGIEEIVLPRLLPHRKEDRQVKEYLCKQYYPSIYAQYHEKIKQKTVPIVLWYEHCYEDFRYGVRDYDNSETKFMTDLITPFFIPDDSPHYFSVFHSAKESNWDHTNVFIVPEEMFATGYRTKWK